MADTVVAAQLTLDSQQANKNVKTFKQELRESEDALIDIKKRFGDLSPEALAAAKHVAQLKDEMNDAREVANLFDPGAKFQVFGNVVRTVAGGFSALTGAIALVGAESEVAEKALLKVQAAMAITEGVNTIVDSAKDFQRLNALIKQSTVFQKANNLATAAAAGVQRLFGVAVTQTSTAFKVLRGAIIATGIGALVVGIGFLVDKIISWTSATEDQEEAQKRLEEATRHLNEALQQQIGISDRNTKENIAAAKARGAAEEELTAIERKGIEERIFLREINLADLKAKGADTFQTELALQAERQNLRIFDFEQEAKIRQKRDEAEKKAREKQIADAKAAREKFLQERLTNEQNAQAQIQKLQLETFLAEIKDEDERNRQRILKQNELERKRIDALNLSSQTKLALIQAINEQEEVELQAIEDARLQKQKERDAERLASAFEAMQQRFEERKAEIMAQNELQAELDAANRTQLDQQLFELDEWYKEKQRIAGDNEELQLQLTKEYERRRTLVVQMEGISRLRIVSGLLGAAAELFGKQTAAGKVLAIAEATINTFAGATLALREKSTLPQPFSTIQKIAAVAAIIATGLKNVKEIAKTPVPGGGAGVSSAPSLSAEAVAPLAPVPQVTTTQLDQESLNQIGNATVRAFVVESDVTNNQERISRLNRAARLGG